MTDVVVERLRITCRSGARARQDALAVRRRMEVIARTHLPQLLEARASAWERDVRLDDLSVRLDFDPRQHDDETVALRWAALIAVAVEEASAANARRPARSDEAARQPGGASVHGPGLNRSGSVEAGASAVRRDAGWAPLLLARALAGSAAATAELAAALLRPALAPDLLAAIGPGGHATVVGLLDSAAKADHARTLQAADDPSDPRDHPATASGPEATPEAARAALLTNAAQAVRVAAEVVPGGAASDHAPDAPADGRFSTACGGLAVVYPWLVALLDGAVNARPGSDPISVRRQALAAVAGHQHLTADPLVRLLAGDDLTAAPAPLTDPDDGAALHEAADELLVSFVGVVPGFERSPPVYVRQGFLLRSGTIDTHASPISIVLSPAPLDPVLPLLPYPLGLFALPWTSTLVLRIERS